MKLKKRYRILIFFQYLFGLSLIGLSAAVLAFITRNELSAERALVQPASTNPEGKEISPVTQALSLAGRGKIEDALLMVDQINSDDEVPPQVKAYFRDFSTYYAEHNVPPVKSTWFKKAKPVYTVHLSSIIKSSSYLISYLKEHEAASKAYLYAELIPYEMLVRYELYSADSLELYKLYLENTVYPTGRYSDSGANILCLYLQAQANVKKKDETLVKGIRAQIDSILENQSAALEFGENSSRELQKIYLQRLMKWTEDWLKAKWIKPAVPIFTLVQNS